MFGVGLSVTHNFGKKEKGKVFFTALRGKWKTSSTCDSMPKSRKYIYIYFFFLLALQPIVGLYFAAL
jgi:hypothetical protein